MRRWDRTQAQSEKLALNKVPIILVRSTEEKMIQM